MKKILPIIIGIASGLIISMIGLKIYQVNIAYGELNWWNEITAFGNFFDWKDVFGPSSKGKDLYNLIYVKRFVVPGKNALTDVAKKYGLTTMEAKSVVGGSILPILNTSYNKSPSMTQERALAVMQNVKESYDILKESYDLQQEVDASIRPSEIFSNNDLSDSGFDLIYDLSKIEEVLFIDVVQNTIGKPYVDGLKSPYLPTADDYKNENYVSGGPDFVSGYKIDLKDKNANGSGGSTGNGGTGGIGNAGGGGTDGQKTDSVGVAGTATTPIGDKKITVDVLKKDLCAVKDDISSALDDFEKEVSNKAPDQASGNPVDSGNANGNPSGSEDKSLGDGNEGAGTPGEKSKDLNVPTQNTTQETLSPAPKDKWADAWCPEDPNVADGGDSYGGLGTTFGDAGFTSLGDVGNSLLNNSSSTLTGAGVGFASKAFSAKASVCVTIKLIKKTLSTYYPGKSCVLCEVKKINDILKKTLDHSLIPNKSTGNMLESAKCKNAMGSLFDMKFVVIKAPIPTPSGGDIILGKNIFESWKKFIDRYQPLLFSSLKVDSVTKFQIENAPAASTQDKIFSDVQKELAISTAAAKKELSNIETSEPATNTALYAQTLIKELNFMSQTFANYKDLLEKTNNVCQEWGQKPDIQ